MPIFTSYDAVGIREDISDIITNISPTKTPFQSSIGREKVTQKFFQWQEDSLRAANINAVTEGADATFITVQPTVMRNNITQIFMEASQVSGTMEVTSTYGRARESAYQLAKSAAQVKRDLEVALVGSSQALTTGSDSAVRYMASYNQMIGFNQSSAGTYTTGVTLVTATGAPYIDYQNLVYSTTHGGTTTVVTETLVLQALEACFNAGGEPNVLMVTPTNSINVATWARSQAYQGGANGGLGGATRADMNRDARKLVNVVDVYVSPFGEVRTVINRFLNGVGSTTAASLGPNGGLQINSGDTNTTNNPWTLLFDPSMWVLATLRPWFREVLAKTGDSIKQMIIGEFSLKHKNYLASAIIVESAAPSNGSSVTF